MRNQLQLQNDQEVYIAIEEEKSFKEGSIKLYKNVLNECIRNRSVDPLVRDYILEGYKSFKFMFRTKKEILNFAESLHQELNRWKGSPERAEELLSLIINRSRRNWAILMVTSALTLALGSYVNKHDDFPVLGNPPPWLGLTLISTGSFGEILSFCGIFRTSNKSIAEKNAFSCVKNRLSHNLDKKHVYSIFSSENLIRDNEEFRGFLESDAGQIENIGQIVTNYLL